MKLTAGNIYLRPLTKGDADQILAAVKVSRDKLRRWSWWADETKTVEDVMRFIRQSQLERRRDSALDFGVFDATDNQYLGGAGLRRINRHYRSGDLGYWVRADRHREGIALAASVTLLRYGFETLELHKITFAANVKNRASLNLIRKLGFVEEGILRHEFITHGKWSDALCGSMLESEYQKLAKSFDRLVPRKLNS